MVIFKRVGRILINNIIGGSSLDLYNLKRLMLSEHVFYRYNTKMQWAFPVLAIKKYNHTFSIKCSQTVSQTKPCDILC
jgi:hypothetical protein